MSDAANIPPPPLPPPKPYYNPYQQQQQQQQLQQYIFPPPPLPPPPYTSNYVPSGGVLSVYSSQSSPYDNYQQQQWQQPYLNAYSPQQCVSYSTVVAAPSHQTNYSSFHHRPVTAGWQNAPPPPSSLSSSFIYSKVNTPIVIPPVLQQQKQSRLSDCNNMKVGSSALSLTLPLEADNIESDFPYSLKDYVARSFLICMNQADYDYMAGHLKEMVSKVDQEMRISVHKWEDEPIPDLSHLTSRNDHESDSSNSCDNCNKHGKGSKKKKRQKKDRELNFRKGKSSDDSESYYGPSSKAFIAAKDQKYSSEVGCNHHNASNQSNTSISSYPYDKLTIQPLYLTDYLNANVTPKSASSTSSINTYGGKGFNSGDINEEEKKIMMRRNRFGDINVVNKSDSSKINDTKKSPNGKSKKSTSTTYSSYYMPSPAYDNSIEYQESAKIVGTCEALEKDYFRLTSQPDPAVVRPLKVLELALASLTLKWKIMRDAGTIDYVYMCSQLKGIRQDATVQHISNDFTVKLYEFHAVVALVCNDLNEYNQCQTQLMHLYKLGYTGNENEYMAYRILYYVYLQGNKKYCHGNSDLLCLLQSLPRYIQHDPAVKHALAIRRAVQQDNYHKFFQLCKVTPNYGKYIVQHIIDTKRIAALQRMSRSYQPSLPITFITEELIFDDDSATIDFVTKIGFIITKITAANAVTLELNTKDSIPIFSLAVDQDKLLL